MADKIETVGGWTRNINYGPEGEENWANLVTPEGDHVANIRTHHADRIVREINRGNPIETAPNDMKLAHKINFEAWSRTLIGFIRHKGLEQELKDWSGGWPCPIGSDPEAPLVYAAAPELLKALKDINKAAVLHGSDGYFLPNDALWAVVKAIANVEGRS